MQSAQFQLHAEIEERHWWFVGRRRLMARLVETVLPPSRESIVVDVGCGTGANLAALAERYRCVGIDNSAEAISLARKRYPNLRFIHGSAPEDLRDLAHQAKLFLLMDVLEHVDDDFQFLSRMLSAAGAGSLFLMTVPANPSLWTEHDESFGHYRRYEMDRFQLLWGGLPVATLLVSYFNSRLLPIIRLFRTINRWRGKASGRAGTDFWIPPPPLNLLLEKIFEGEARRLIKTAAACNGGGYAQGASLIAVLRREAGQIPLRRRPDDVPPDRHPSSRTSGA